MLERRSYHLAQWLRGKRLARSTGPGTDVMPLRCIHSGREPTNSTLPSNFGNTTTSNGYTIMAQGPRDGRLPTSILRTDRETRASRIRVAWLWHPDRLESPRNTP